MRLTPSSTLPLQLLSRLSQTSFVGPVVRTQLMTPAWHTFVPAAQTPIWPVEHAAPPPGFPLSTVPLQSSSALLQVSAIGSVWPGVAAVHAGNAPALHACETPMHTPWGTQ